MKKLAVFESKVRLSKLGCGPIVGSPQSVRTPILGQIVHYYNLFFCSQVTNLPSWIMINCYITYVPKAIYRLQSSFRFTAVRKQITRLMKKIILKKRYFSVASCLTF